MAPKYRPGQHAAISPEHLCGHGKEYTGVRILYSDIEGNYFVRVLRSGGFAIVPEEALIAIEEVETPADRHNIRVVFFGNGEFALPTLQYLVEKGYDVCAVVTMPDKPQGRGLKPRASAVKRYAFSSGLHVLQPTDLKDASFRSELSALRPTVGVVVEYRMLPTSVFSLPRWGTINLHSSLLPMYRGASPIASAIANGDEVTGVTTILIDNNTDTGSIINNLAIGIGGEDCAGDIHAKLKHFGALMVDDAIQRVAHSCPTCLQSELECDFILPSITPKINRESRYIPWQRPMRDIYNFIRSLAPMPGAIAELHIEGENTPVTIRVLRTSKTSLPPSPTRYAGEIRIADHKLLAECADGVLSIEELQWPGKRRMSAAAFIDGWRGPATFSCQIPANS